MKEALEGVVMSMAAAIVLDFDYAFFYIGDKHIVPNVLYSDALCVTDLALAWFPVCVVHCFVEKPLGY